MKTKNRILSFFLAFLMLFTTIMPAVTETVHAASVGTYFTFRLELLSYNYAGSKQRAGAVDFFSAVCLPFLTNWLNVGIIFTSCV